MGSLLWVFSLVSAPLEIKVICSWPKMHVLENTLMLGKIEGMRRRGPEKGTTEDEIVGWHHRLNEHEFEQAPWDGERQRSLVCCSPWGCKESDKTTEWLNNKMHTCFCASCGSTWIRTFPRWKSVRSSSSTDLTCQSTMVTWIDHHAGHGHSCSIQNLAPK